MIAKVGQGGKLACCGIFVQYILRPGFGTGNGVNLTLPLLAHLL
jgi:hypothetical protein